MRFVNEQLYAIIFLLLFASARLFGQTQGNAISLIDSYNSAGNNGALSCGAGCLQYPEALATNDVLVLGAAQENASCSAGVSNPPWTITDSQANTWTTQTQVSTGTNGHLQIACMKVTHPGTDQITVAGIDSSTGCASSVSISRFKNASCTLDGSLINSNTPAGTGVQTVSTSVTTTVNGDLLVSAGVPVFGPQGSMTPDGPTAMYSSYAAQNNVGFSDVLQTYAVTGNLGSYSMGMAICCGGSASQQGFVQTIALKPATTIAIGDTVLHDAAANVPYAEQLHCVGGILAPTYSLFSGSFPAGITLNTATGLISGTTSSTGTSSLQFKCTDGTAPSAAQTLSLNVGAGFNAPLVKSSSTFSADVSPNTQTVTAACGDLLVVVATGADTHHGIGWVQAVSGANSFWSDSFNSPVQRLITNAGTSAAPLVVYVLGPLTQSGSDVISYQNNGGASSGLPPVLLLDVSGAQAVLDTGTLKTSTVASVPSIAQSLTTLVPNEFVLAGTLLGDPGGSISFAAPFSLIASGSDIGVFTKAYASASVAAASTVTATSTFTGSATNTSTLLMALRPALPIAACGVFTGAGEKKRRSMN